MHKLAYKTSGRLPTFVHCKFTHQTFMASLSHRTNMALQTKSKLIFLSSFYWQRVSTKWNSFLTANKCLKFFEGKAFPHVATMNGVFFLYTMLPWLSITYDVLKGNLHAWKRFGVRSRSLCILCVWMGSSVEAKQVAVSTHLLLC